MNISYLTIEMFLNINNDIFIIKQFVSYININIDIIINHLFLIFPARRSVIVAQETAMVPDIVNRRSGAHSSPPV